MGAKLNSKAVFEPFCAVLASKFAKRANKTKEFVSQ
jgi:hypothetical protein